MPSLIKDKGMNTIDNNLLLLLYIIYISILYYLNKLKKSINLKIILYCV